MPSRNYDNFVVTTKAQIFVTSLPSLASSFICFQNSSGVVAVTCATSKLASKDILLLPIHTSLCTTRTLFNDFTPQI